MENVSMYEAMRDMLNWLFDTVLTFLNSAPGVYFWAIVLIFFVIGIFVNIFKDLLTSIDFDRRR